MQRTGFVPVATKSPGVDGLATLLFDGAEPDEIAARFHAGLLFKLPNRRREQVFTRLDLAFRDAPVPVVLLREKRSARMRQENLQPAVAHPIHQEASADSVLSFHPVLVFLLKAAVRWRDDSSHKRRLGAAAGAASTIGALAPAGIKAATRR